MNNIAIANETMKICEAEQYEIDGMTVRFPAGDFKAVEVLNVAAGKELLGKPVTVPDGKPMCKISIINSDSYAAAKRYENALVLNFANAHHPGGGFKLGANAQEEALCRCSTLYASISGEAASEMYRYNNRHFSVTESDYMLISPCVLVFRDEKCNLLATPFRTAVITAPAPNRYGRAALVPAAKIRETFERRIRIILLAAAERGYKNLVLGAWGCGAFGNCPADVAEAFRTVIVDEKLGCFFTEICFAVYGTENGRNITAFREVLQ